MFHGLEAGYEFAKTIGQVRADGNFTDRWKECWHDMTVGFIPLDVREKLLFHVRPTIKTVAAHW